MYTYILIDIKTTLPQVGIRSGKFEQIIEKRIMMKGAGVWLWCENIAYVSVIQHYGDQI